MNKLFPVLLAGLALTMAGCKSNDAVDAKNEVAAEATKKANKNGKDIRCRSEAPTGSRIAKMKCTTRKQRQARSQTKDALNDVINGQVGAMKGPIGGGGE